MMTGRTAATTEDVAKDGTVPRSAAVADRSAVRRGPLARLRLPFSRSPAEPAEHPDPPEPREPADRWARPRRWPWILAMVLVVGLLAGAVDAVFFSGLLSVQAVTVSGAPGPVVAKVLAVVDVPDGTPLARVDLDGVAVRVNEVPEIAEVEVARNWPNTLAITVTPRVPIAVTSANGRLWLMDRTGDPYLTVDVLPADVVVVRLATPGVGDPSTVAALSVVNALTPQFRSQVADLTARTPYDVELTLKDKRTVIWGEATDSAQKMQILPAVLAQGGSTYNISDPTLVSVR
jgi:cell division protein FtsQ